MEYLTDTMFGDVYAQQTNYPLFSLICKNRSDRYVNALRLHTAENFSIRPKQTLLVLNNMLQAYDDAYQLDNDNLWLEKKNIVQEKINTGDYLTEESGPDWDYRQAYISHMQSFVWPSQEEIAQREIERNQLLGLI